MRLWTLSAWELREWTLPLCPNVIAIFIVVGRFASSSRGDLPLTQINREEWEQWAAQIPSEEEDLYDPEYYAGHISWLR